jgi:hypothetical protein
LVAVVVRLPALRLKGDENRNPGGRRGQIHQNGPILPNPVGMSLSDYLLIEIKEIAVQPTLAGFRERLRRREQVAVQLDTACLVREEREA